MSLVAYDASSDEEDAAEPPAAATASPPLIASSIGPQPRPQSPSTSVGAAPQPTPPAPRQNVAPTSSSNVSLPTPSLDLPDVADLFAPPSLQSLQSRATGHSSRENASRKRESNGSTFNDSCSKFPRMQSQPHGSRSAAGNTLIPPQLRGRRNVVTEDMSKLFVAKLKE